LASAERRLDEEDAKGVAAAACAAKAREDASNGVKQAGEAVRRQRDAERAW